MNPAQTFTRDPGDKTFLAHDKQKQELRIPTTKIVKSNDRASPGDWLVAN